MKKEGYAKKKSVYDVYTLLLAELRGRTAIKKEYIILGIPFIIDDELSPDACLFSCEDIEHKFTRNEVYESITDISIIQEEKISELINLKVTPETYAYEFIKWDEVLGYKIDSHNAETFGKAQLFACILSEMTFFGLSEDSVDEGRKKLEEAIAEAEEIIALPKEEQSKRILTSEELKKTLGIDDERSSENKISTHINLREMLRNKIIAYNTVKEYKQEI